MRHLFLLASAACATTSTTAQPSYPASEDGAKKFIGDMDAELRELWFEADKIAWIKNTYITEDTDWLASRSTEKVMATARRLVDDSRTFQNLELDAESKRKLELLVLLLSAPGPSDPAARRELAEIRSFLTSTYGTGKVCTEDGNQCLDLNGLVKVMAQSRDYDELLRVWEGWRGISPPMRDKYARFVELVNKGAQQIGFADAGDLWRSRYDMSPEEFEKEAGRLWLQVKPLYESLHCYVRGKLSDHYGHERVPREGPIPAHILGNMWAQEWGNIYDLVEPYPGKAALDVTKALVERGYDAKRMTEAGEGFFVSLGLEALPETFWQRSMLTKPRDREVVCHASAWEMGGRGDVRIKMCTEVTEEDFSTVHHELGHIYYYLYYDQHPVLFQAGAHDGFHEGIGDTLVLSITPGYLEKIGVFDKVPSSPEAGMNVLMKRALDKVAFLPFGKMIDQWRWEVFDGRIPPAEYNAGWWRLRTELQGVAPPAERTEESFDPGAKFHIPNNTPYARYFLAHILQFQFHRALCRAAGHEGPLHTCSIYGSKEAGNKLAAMLELGATKPWPEALEAMSGERTMDAGALLEYFAPLKTYLDEANKKEKCGW